jgi:hypothetical protein
VTREARPLDDAFQQRALVLLTQALEQPEAQRESYLRSHCEGDVELEREVLSLLAHDAASGSLEPGQGARMLRGIRPPATMSSAPDGPAIASGPKAGDSIGRYKLLQEIGEGGFGVVWMAEQLRPVKRKVALKVIKLGMDTKAVVARFEAERQALALMDHPSIAKVFDGSSGASRSRPTATRPSSRSGTGSGCSPKCAVHSSTRTARGSSTGTSSPATCSSRCSTASRSPR